MAVAQNVRKLIDAASDTSLASACLSLAMDVDMDPRLSPAMAGAWRLYRESDVKTVRSLSCAGTIFESGIRLADLLIWASRYGSNTFLVLNNAEERSEMLRRHLVDVTQAVVEAGWPGAGNTVKQLWTEWFGALMPDLNAHGRRLPMIAYAVLALETPHPKANWPRQLQVRWCACCHGACGVFHLLHLVTTQALAVRSVRGTYCPVLVLHVCRPCVGCTIKPPVVPR